MKVLIVCSGNNKNISPFIEEQAESLRKNGVELDFFLIRKGGFLGYLRNLKKLKLKIISFQPDLVHAHYGLSGMLAVLQRKIPTVITFHGSDINNPKIRIISRIAMYLAKENIFVSEKLFKKSKLTKGHIIPCGVDFEIFFPIEQNQARNVLKLSLTKKYILFSSCFQNKDKNAALAIKAVSLLEDSNVELIELINFSRKEVNLLLNAVNVAILTSENEGSPQFIKEALACNCPIVATDVGDIKANVQNVDATYLTSFEAADVAAKLILALGDGKNNGREKIKEFELNNISLSLISVYQKTMN